MIDPARELPVFREGTRIGSLRAIGLPITDEIAAALTRWRAANAACFLTRFEPSVERTRRWLSDIVVPDRTRRLYVVFDDHDRAIGTIGLLHLDRDPIELDNILRGESSGHRELMSHAMIAAMSAVRPAGFHLFVLSDNPRAIRLYERLGFAITARFGLMHEQTSTGLVLHKREMLATPSVELHLVEMTATS